MRTTTLHWFLGGALGMSLAAHAWRSVAGDEGPVLDLQLAPQQQADLQACCGGVCGVDDDLAGQRRQAMGELVRALRDPNWNEDDVRAIGAHLADLAKRDTELCVDGAIALRGILTLEQVEQISSCCPIENP